MLIQYNNIIVFRKRQLKETVDKNVTLDGKTQLSPVIGILDFFFLSGISVTDIDNSQDSRRRE